MLTMSIGRGDKLIARLSGRTISLDIDSSGEGEASKCLSPHEARRLAAWLEAAAMVVESENGQE